LILQGQVISLGIRQGNGRLQFHIFMFLFLPARVDTAIYSVAPAL